MPIKPTNGRIVWFYPAIGDPAFPPITPEYRAERGGYAAMVTWCHNDGTISVLAADGAGNPHGRRLLPLRQDDEPDPEGAFCEWMPYQRGQAAKHDAAKTA
jgi:hypothetical protein